MMSEFETPSTEEVKTDAVPDKPTKLRRIESSDSVQSVRRLLFETLEGGSKTDFENGNGEEDSNRNGGDICINENSGIDTACESGPAPVLRNAHKGSVLSPDIADFKSKVNRLKKIKVRNNNGNGIMNNSNVTKASRCVDFDDLPNSDSGNNESNETNEQEAESNEEELPSRYRNGRKIQYADLFHENTEYSLSCSSSREKIIPPQPTSSKCPISKKSILRKVSKYADLSTMSPQDILFSPYASITSTPSPFRNKNSISVSECYNLKRTSNVLDTKIPTKKIRISEAVDIHPIESFVCEEANSDCSVSSEHETSCETSCESVENNLVDVEDIDLLDEIETDSRSNEDEDVECDNCVCTLSWEEVFGEKLAWISPSARPLQFDLIQENVVKAMRVPVKNKFSVEIDMHYIDSSTITQFLKAKETINSIGAAKYEIACHKYKANLYQGGNNYVYKENATKLESIDRILEFDLMFPKITHKTESRCDCGSKKFYFVDIWKTSKGFQEYMLKKSEVILKNHDWEVQGVTICDNGDAVLPDYISTTGILFISPAKKQRLNIDYSKTVGILFPSSDLHLHSGYGQHFSLNEEISGDSCKLEPFIDWKGNYDGFDITNIHTSDDFVERVLQITDNEGVHLVLADNPELIHCHETVREVRFRKKFYSQIIIALLTLRTGGDFIVKIFDAVTPFTVALIFLIHRCFDYISIHKPQSTSPAFISERFLICRGKRNGEEIDEILDFLLKCHPSVMKPEVTKKTVRTKFRKRVETQILQVTQLVPLSVITSHGDFFEFLRLSNKRWTDEIIYGINQFCEKF